MINIIWAVFVIAGVIFGLFDNPATVNTTIINSTKSSLEMLINIFPVIALWMGLMNIAEQSGMLDKFAKIIYPFLSKLFPDIPKNHKSFSLIASNIVANICGLGNAGTPIALKTMKSLQEINPKKDTASRSMITFLVINTCGFTIIPTTIISLRIMHKSANPTIIISSCIISTLIATISGLTLDKILSRRK